MVASSGGRWRRGRSQPDVAVSITCEVTACHPRHSYRRRRDERGRRPPTRLAPAAAPEPDGPRARGRRLHPAPELRRDRPLAPQPADARAPRRAARRPAARPQPAPPRRRLRPRLPRARPRRARDGPRPRGARPRPLRARAVPGGRRRPRLEPRRGQRERRHAARGRRAAPARAARQRPAPQPAPRGHGPAHPQPRRVARAPARAPRPPGGAHGRRRARRAARGARHLPGARGACDRRRDRGPAAGAHRRRRPRLREHRRDLRHRRRHHGRRAVDRVLLPRRRRDGGSAPRLMRHVDPDQPRGLPYRAWARVVGTRPFGWISRGVGWRVDPLLLRLTRGRFGMGLAIPTALLETRGARTGQPRRNAVIYFHDGGDVIIIASKLGAPEHPAWFHNARANPEVILGGEPFRAHVVVDDAERARLWALADRVLPAYARYRARTTRTIPILRLVPR